ncbi:TolC family protein [bacterium]|nr:TolC family protein [bacterium]
MSRLIVFIITSLGCFWTSHGQTLEDYYSIAAENNPGLKAKYLEFEAAVEHASAISGFPNPSLSFGYFILPVETRVGPQTAKLSLNQMIPWFGTLKVKEEAAALNAEAKFQVFINARNELKLKISQVYYRLFELDNLIQIQKDNLEVLSSFSKTAEVKYQNGDGSMTDLIRLQILINEATTEIEILEYEKKTMITSFRLLLNQDNLEEVATPESLEIWNYIFEQNLDSIFESNPLLNELDLKVQKSEVEQILASKQGMPQLGLGFDYVIVNKRADMNVDNNGRDVLMPMFTVSLPIYRSQYNAQLNEARKLQSVYEYQKLELLNELERNFECSRYELYTEKSRIELYQRQIEDSELNLNLLLTEYSNSGQNFEEVLRMQQQILEYQKLKVSAISNWFTAIAKLEYITAKS